jgi:hypothetical protein
MLLSKFGNEVLSRGPEAVLPQNLDPQWLETIQELADDFLDSNFQGGNCRASGFSADPLLSACVSEILSRCTDGGVAIEEREMFEKITMYALSVTMETVRRGSGLEMAQPTLENIFQQQRFAKLKNLHPDIGPVLKAICLNGA